MEKRQGVVLQLGGWAWGQQPYTIKSKLVTECSNETETYTNSRNEQPKRQNMDKIGNIALKEFL
jgi:hypothetical protein